MIAMIAMLLKPEAVSVSDLLISDLITTIAMIGMLLKPMAASVPDLLIACFNATIGLIGMLLEPKVASTASAFEQIFIFGRKVNNICIFVDPLILLRT
jgi:hypothetical protein